MCKRYEFVRKVSNAFLIRVARIIEYLHIVSILIECISARMVGMVPLKSLLSVMIDSKMA